MFRVLTHAMPTPVHKLHVVVEVGGRRPAPSSIHLEALDYLLECFVGLPLHRGRSSLDWRVANAWVGSTDEEVRSWSFVQRQTPSSKGLGSNLGVTQHTEGAFIGSTGSRTARKEPYGGSRACRIPLISPTIHPVGCATLSRVVWASRITSW